MINYSWRCLSYLVIVVLILPGLIISFPGIENSYGFADHPFSAGLLDHHVLQNHSDTQPQHEPASHSHETPDRQELFLLLTEQIGSCKSYDSSTMQPCRMPWLLDRPPKISG